MDMNAGRPREFDEEATLERVMNSFWRHGFEETTFEQLVADSGLSRSSLYNAFGGKEELFRKAMELYVDREHDEFTEQLSDEASGGEYLRSLVQTFREPYNRRSKGCLLQKTILRNAADGGRPKQECRIARCLGEIWESFKLAMSNIRRKKPKPMTEDERAAVLLAVMFGIVVICRNGRNKELVNTITDGAAKLIEE